MTCALTGCFVNVFASQCEKALEAESGAESANRTPVAAFKARNAYQQFAYQATGVER